MPNKIHQQLKKLAKEILEMEEPYDYEKAYDATLLLLESLILIKNTNGFKDNFRENLEKNLDQVGILSESNQSLKQNMKILMSLKICPPWWILRNF